jgi:hypothetical protein
MRSSSFRASVITFSYLAVGYSAQPPFKVCSGSSGLYIKMTALDINNLTLRYLILVH